MPQIDRYPGTDASLSAPSRRGAVITPHDTNLLEEIPKYLYCGATGGTIAVIDDDDNVLTFTVVAGQALYFRPKAIKATGTTATPIIACY